MRTIRMVFSQWKGGENPNYFIGAKLLAEIAPPSKEEPLITIDIAPPIEKNLNSDEKIAFEKEQLRENQMVENYLEAESPDRIIVFGGDCSVSQVPFDYLNQKYHEKVGIIWLDSHPDISTTEISNHNHEMVLANLLGLGDNKFSESVKKPFSSNKVIYVGLVEDSKEKQEALKLNIPYIPPEGIIRDFEQIKSFIKDNDIDKICVHFDLDVLSPKDFYSLTSNKPYQTAEEYGAAVGKLKLSEVIEFLNKVNQEAEIVGLSIAEFVPWDAINLRRELAKLPIFEA